MDLDLPRQLIDYLAELDAFIASEIKPLEQEDDNIRFFDHRRENASKTDVDNVWALTVHDSFLTQWLSLVNKI